MSSITTCTMTVFSWTLTVLLLSLFVAGTYTSVAPQDADPSCLNLLDRPATNPRQVILLDTGHYMAQHLVTILGQSRMWISLKFESGPSNQKVNLTCCVLLSVCSCNLFVFLFIYFFFLVGRPRTVQLQSQPFELLLQ